MLTGAEEVAALEQRIADTGYYSHRCSPDEEAALRDDPDALHALFVRRIVERMEQWMALADERLGGADGMPCFINAGNDDPPEIDAVIDAAERVEFLEGRVVRLPERDRAGELRLRQPDAVELPARRRGARAGAAAGRRRRRRSRTRAGRCSTSTARRTTPRSTRGRGSARTCACARPRAGSRCTPVGSTACRAVIERYQPLMGLHGHLHESRGTVKIGRTVCVNPGQRVHRGRSSAAR